MKPDTVSEYASKSVNFSRMSARRDTHQKLSIFQGLIPIENCQHSKKMDTHYTHYASKSVNFSRKASTKSISAKLVYQKKTAVTLQASHRGKEDRSGKGDTHHLLGEMQWGSSTTSPYHCASDDVAVEDELHAASVVETCIAIEPLRAEKFTRLPHPAVGPHYPRTATTTRTRADNTTTVPEMRAGATDQDRIIRVAR
jgi:hypothetical protein